MNIRGWELLSNTRVGEGRDFGHGPNAVSESMVSSTELSEFPSSGERAP